MLYSGLSASQALNTGHSVIGAMLDAKLPNEATLPAQPETYISIVDFSDMMLRGSTRLTGSDILIGAELSADLGLNVSDKLHVTAANGAESVLTNSGVFELGNEDAKAMAQAT
ncbi:MAG: hypothetical protein HXX19_12920 [Rhodoferax sp.]|nr:hypothetical protein [Rhodoferax sp.]